MEIINKIIVKLAVPFIRESIVLESVPDFSDNTKAVFDELVKRGFNKKYYLFWEMNDKRICLLNDKKKPYYFTAGKNNSIKEKLLCISFYDKVKAGICCNGFLDKRNPHEILFFLGHGGPYKATKGYYSIPSHIDYAISLSDYLSPIIAEQHNFDANKIIALGYPRNDILVKSNFDSKAVFNNAFQKIVVWYPTYRQHRNGFSIVSSKSIPLLYDTGNAQKLNEIAKKNNTLIIIKPHFAQDVSYLEKLELSNIKFINDDFFKQLGTSSYEFIANCDALLTDYSSVYYDYLLCNKPIGVIWEDIEEYKKFPGFAVDLDYILQGAEKIYTLEELQKFISDVANGIDELNKKRAEIRDLTNYATDGCSSQRVVDFIIEKAGL